VPAFFDFTGHVGLITGGNGGIGLGMARGLKAAGADVAIWGTNPDKNAAATAELEGIGDRKVLALQCDVGDEAQVEAAFAETVAALGKVDSCFANAGVGAGAPIQDMELDTWRHVQRVNSEGVFLRERRSNNPTHDLLGQLAEGAADLLTSPSIRKVRRCEGPDCRLLFLPAHPGAAGAHLRCAATGPGSPATTSATRTRLPPRFGPPERWLVDGHAAGSHVCQGWFREEVANLHL
jgi:hypothetical protein